MAWRVASSLLTLLSQLNQEYPGRSRISDGTIGDLAHQATVSDHNPNGAGVVTALDITQDPANGADMGVLAQVLMDSRDPRIKYIIWNRRIYVPPYQAWQPYNGVDPHTNHLHLSVSASAALYDNAVQWQVRKPEGPEVIENTEMAVKLGRMLRPNSGSTADETRVWVGQPYREVINAMMNEVYKRDEDLLRVAAQKNELIVTLQNENNTLIGKMKDDANGTAEAIIKAQTTAPSATKASWFQKLLAALTRKK